MEERFKGNCTTLTFPNRKVLTPWNFGNFQITSEINSCPSVKVKVKVKVKVSGNIKTNVGLIWYKPSLLI